MITLECLIPDYPGSLIEFIKPISDNQGNIFGILHYHDKKRNNMIPVSVSFDLPQELMESSLDKIQKELRNKTYITSSVNERYRVIKSWVINYMNFNDMCKTNDG